MSQSPIRVALIGAGAMANAYHYPSLASFPDVELVAISDLVESKAVETAARFGIPRKAIFSDYKRMLADMAPQAIYVLMPPQHVYEPAHHVLSQGYHLFIEKPLALTLPQARMLAYTAGEHDCLTMVGFQRRFVPAVTELRAAIEETGPIHFASVAFLKSTPDLGQTAGFYDGAIDPLTSDGIHAVDNLRWLCGGEVEEVHRVVRKRAIPGPIPNAFSALVTFSTGAMGHVDYNLVTGQRIFRAEFHGLNSTAYVDADRDSMLVLDNRDPSIVPSRDYGRGAAGDGPLEPWHWLGFWHESRHFIDAIKAGQQPGSHFADAVKSMELTARIYDGGSE